jgi:hypothetical protein
MMERVSKRQRIGRERCHVQAVDNLVLPEDFAMLEHFLPMNPGARGLPGRTCFSF